VIGRKPLKESEPHYGRTPFKKSEIQKSLGSKVNRLKSASLSKVENPKDKSEPCPISKPPYLSEPKESRHPK